MRCRSISRQHPPMMPHMQCRLLFLCALLSLPIVAFSGEATVAMVDFDLVDTSLQGEMMPSSSKPDIKRLERTEKQIRDQINNSKYFKVIGDETTARINEQLRQNQVYLHECNGCEMRVGKAVDSEYVLVGWVQKVSNLILNLNLVLRKVPGDEDIVGASVDMRGNTNEAWSRAATYLLKHNFFPQYAKLQKKSAS